MTDSLILVGFMGAGKTTVGAELQEQLNIPQLDLDELIEQDLDEKISAYFEREGEAAFRQKETSVLKNYIEKNVVLSTGGGVIMRDINRVLLNSATTPIVYLRTQPQALMERLQNDLQRPLLKQMDQQEFLDLWNFREPLYSEVADVIIDTDDKTPESIAKEIRQSLE